MEHVKNLKISNSKKEIINKNKSKIKKKKSNRNKK